MDYVIRYKNGFDAPELPKRIREIAAPSLAVAMAELRRTEPHAEKVDVYNPSGWIATGGAYGFKD